MKAVVVSLLGTVTATLPATAQDEPRHPPITRQVFKLNPDDGCFRYAGTAVEFTGRFLAGAYVRVAMSTLDATGQPVPAADEQRIPSMDAPEFKTADPASWFGPLRESRAYSIGFTPSAAFGHPGRVVICGRTSPPEQNTQLQFTPEEGQRLNQMADDMIANDPHTRSLIDEPKVLGEKADDEGSEADVCGFPVRNVSIRAGDGADASMLQPRVAGSMKHYANLYESPFAVFAVCTPANAGQAPKTIKLPRNTRDCYFAGDRLECSYLAEGEIVHVE